MKIVTKTFTFGAKSIKLFIVVAVENNSEETTFVYSGHAVAMCLGYKLPRKAIRDNTIPRWRTTWKEMEKKGISGVEKKIKIELPPNWQPNTVFLKEAGVYALIMRTKRPEAEQFQQWLFEEVVPELRRSEFFPRPIQSVSKDEPTISLEEEPVISLVQLADMKLKLLEERNALQTTVLNYDVAMAEMEEKHAKELGELREKEQETLRSLKEVKMRANVAYTQFAWNALLALDNIEENKKLRNTLLEVKDYIVPILGENPDKEEYLAGYERNLNGKLRIRICRSQLHEIHMHDNIIKKYIDTGYKPRDRRFHWFCGAQKFFHRKCPNPVAVWVKARQEYPYFFYGLRYTNKLKTEIEPIPESELRKKFINDVELFRRNRPGDSKQILDFIALNLANTEECILRCLTNNCEEVKEGIVTILDEVMLRRNSHLIPVEPVREHKNAGELYTNEQLLHVMHNPAFFFIKRERPPNT